MSSAWFYLLLNIYARTCLTDDSSCRKELRNARWTKAFSESAAAVSESGKDAIDRKATIVIEHIIQASDIAHTMQHW